MSNRLIHEKSPRNIKVECPIFMNFFFSSMQTTNSKSMRNSTKIDN